MTRYPLYRRLGRPQGRSGRVRKISPPPGFDPRIAQPVASRYTDCAIPARLHANASSWWPSVTSINVLYSKIYIIHSVHCRLPIHNTQTIKCTALFVRYLYYNITLNIPTCFDPQGIIVRESNQSITAVLANLFLCGCFDFIP